MLNLLLHSKKPAAKELRTPTGLSLEELQIITETSVSILSSLTLDEVLQQSIDKVVKEYGLLGGLLFLVEGDFLRAKTIAHGLRSDAFVNLIGRKISSLQIEISSSSDNFVVKSVVSGERQFSYELFDFTRGVLSSNVTSVARTITGTHACIAIPIRFRSKTIGALFFSKQTAQDFTEELPLLNLVSNQIGIAIANARLYEEQQKQLHDVEIRNKQLELINTFTNRIITTLEVDEIAQNALDSIPQVLDYLGALYNTVDLEKNRTRLTAFTRSDLSNAAFGMLPKKPWEYEMDLNEPENQTHMHREVLLQDKIIIREHLSDLTQGLVPDVISRNIEKFLGLKHVVAIPVKSKNKIVGILDFLVSNRQEGELSQLDLDTMTIISNQIGIALDNAYLYKEKEKALGKLEQSNKELGEKYQYEKDMMGIMGHELRTPITVARGMVELVLAKMHKEECTPEYIEDKLRKVHESILKEADLIQIMLSTSHVDNNKLNLQLAEVDLDSVVEYSVSAFKGDAQAKKLKLDYIKAETKIPHIQSDMNRVQEIVNNLISNAVKYTNDGSVKVTIESTSEFVIVHVVDSGIGIPETELKNIGKKFYRIHQHLDEFKDVVRAGGTGLGLYVVKGVLNALGGELKVESTVGNGSTFSAVFPINPTFGKDVIVTENPVDKHDMFAQLGLVRSQ